MSPTGPLPPELVRGHLDLILLSILDGGPLYGFAVMQEARERTGGYFDLREGSLYPALHRLEQGGLLSAQAGEPGRSGKPRKYYAITATGREALRQKQREFERFSAALRLLTP